MSALPLGPALDLALFALTLAVCVAALLVLLIVIRVLVAIRAFVGVLASMPDIIPTINVQPAPSASAPTASDPSPPTGAPYPGHLPPEWAEHFRRQWGGPVTDEQTDGRTTPPYAGDADNFNPAAVLGEPAARSKEREDLRDD